MIPQDPLKNVFPHCLPPIRSLGNAFLFSPTKRSLKNSKIINVMFQIKWWAV
jgi:hypothetical protein